MFWTCWPFDLESAKEAVGQEKGQALLEYAVVLPVILLLLLAGLQVVVVAVDKIVLANAAYDAARARATVQHDGDAGELASIRDLARRRSRAALSNTGFVNMRVGVRLSASNGDSVASVSLRQELLPLVKQAVMAAGGSPSIRLQETASFPAEPYQP